MVAATHLWKRYSAKKKEASSLWCSWTIWVIVLAQPILGCPKEPIPREKMDITSILKWPKFCANHIPSTRTRVVGHPEKINVNASAAAVPPNFLMAKY